MKKLDYHQIIKSNNGSFFEGTENILKDEINILDSLGIINNSISGTGGLLNN